MAEAVFKCGRGGGLVAQLCPAVWDTMDYSLPRSSIHGLYQERILELPFLPPDDLPDIGIKPWSPALQADSLPTQLP